MKALLIYKNTELVFYDYYSLFESGSFLLSRNSSRIWKVYIYYLLCWTLQLILTDETLCWVWSRVEWGKRCIL